jgi:hypothetical protein
VGIVLSGELLRRLATEGFHWHETINRAFYENTMSSSRPDQIMHFKGIQITLFHIPHSLPVHAETH